MANRADRLAFTRTGLKQFINDLVDRLPIQRLNRNMIAIGNMNDAAILIQDLSGYVYKDSRGDYKSGTLGSTQGTTFSSKDIPVIASQLISLTLPDYITRIAPETFKYCNNLTDITFGPNVQLIGASAFPMVNNADKLQINYLGTDNEWQQTYIGNNNYRLINGDFNFLMGEQALTTVQAANFLQQINSKLDTNYSNLNFALTALLECKITKKSALLSENDMSDLLVYINNILGTNYTSLSSAIVKLGEEVKKYKEV